MTHGASYTLWVATYGEPRRFVAGRFALVGEPATVCDGASDEAVQFVVAGTDFRGAAPTATRFRR